MKCKECNGKGSVKCPSCKGKGQHYRVLASNFECKHCNGSGVKKCGVCNGKGYSQFQFMVRIICDVCARGKIKWLKDM